MIASLRGRLIYKDAGSVVIECAGVGYGLAMSVTSLARLGSEGSEAQVFVYTHVGQDVLRLYGFADAEERRVFEILIGTSGVGPRMALAILSSLNAEELAQALANDDRLTLTRIPGVGKKTAERLLLELKDRLKPGLGRVSAPSPRQDLLSALLNLGFGEAAATEAVRHAMQALPGISDIAALMREALRSTTRVHS